MSAPTRQQASPVGADVTVASALAHAPAAAQRPASEAGVWLPRSRVTGGRVRALVDAAALTAVTFVAASTDVAPMPTVFLGLFPVVALFLLYVRGAYRLRFPPEILEDLRLVVVTTALAGMVVISTVALAGVTEGAAEGMVRQWLLSVLAVCAGRLILGSYLSWVRRTRTVAVRTVVFGTGDVARSVAERLRRYPALGLQPVGFVDDDPLGDDESAVPVLGSSADLEQLVRAHGVEHVILAFSSAPHSTLLSVLRRCEEMRVRVSLVPRLFEAVGEQLEMTSVGALPLMTMSAPSPRGWQLSLKYALDCVFAALLLVFGSVLMCVCAIGVWLSIGRPVYFRQLRVGKQGRVFEMLKFRTMLAGAGATPDDLPPDTAPGGVEGDDRRSGFGEVLRRYSLDELPQLINVLKGDMSLIGPRPERPLFVARFQRTVPRYDERHRVRPGITGWAQIHGLRGQSSLEDRVEWDNYYIENWSVWLDFKIVILTFFELIRFDAE